MGRNYLLEYKEFKQVCKEHTAGCKADRLHKPRGTQESDTQTTEGGQAVLVMGRLSVILCCSITKSCLTFCEPMDHSTPGFPVLQYLPKFAHIRVH